MISPRAPPFDEAIYKADTNSLRRRFVSPAVMAVARRRTPIPASPAKSLQIAPAASPYPEQLEEEEEWPSTAVKRPAPSHDEALCTRGGFFLSLMLVIATAIIASAATLRSTRDSSITSGATHLQWHGRRGKFSLLRHNVPVLAAALTSTTVVPSEHPDCIWLDVAAGGTLHVDLASSGHWYGGPALAQSFWPSSLGRVTRQRWASNDMLSDRTKLGSVLEGTWMTSSGVSLQLPHAASAPEFDMSFNVPCTDRDDARSDGQLCIMRPAGDDATPLLVEVCTSEDVRTAQQRLMARTPRPVAPQPPSLDLLRAPIWSTWARFKMDVDQHKVEAYASEIVAHDFPRSHLEVDDKWSPLYGDLDFDSAKFPNPRGMVEELGRQGFSVTLWVTPFAEKSSAAYAVGKANGYWLTAADSSEPIMVTWWQGEGVALNVSNPEALDWMERRLRQLMASTGVSGFKFDAGEAQFVPDGAMPRPNEYCSLWADFAARFGGGGEVRCACSSQGAGVWTREFDKDSRWSHHNGLRALLTAALHMSTLGYFFVLPDMVGGNAYSDAMLGDGEGDGVTASPEASPQASPAALSSMFYGALPARELYVRWCAANALLPAVQFSISPWQYDEDATRACRRALALRQSRLPLLESLAARAVSHGEPIVRPMWWHDPRDATCLWLDDQYMLGNATLVAPVLEAAATTRSVYLPAGRWVDLRQREYEGPTWLVEHPVALDELALFELVSGHDGSALQI